MALNQLYLQAARELRLNAGQRQAYESQGHCVIIAGPGSGKTKTLTVKIARVLSKETKEPRGLACVTYSNECARELRVRLARLGIEESKRVFIGTVHSFCLRNILAPYACLAGLSVPYPITLASAAEQRDAFAAAVASLMGPHEPPARWRTIVDRHRRLYFDRSKQSGFRTDRQLSSLAEEYEAYLGARGLIDFEDIVRFGVYLLSNVAWVRRVIEARVPLFVVDEYQDLGPALHSMVRTLCRQTRVRLISDDDIQVWLSRRRS